MDHLHSKQMLRRKTAALLAVLLASPLQSLAGDRAPAPTGSGWVHLAKKCRHGGSYCPGSYQSGVKKQANYVISYWGRNAGKRGKIFYLDMNTTYPGQPAGGRSFFVTYVVNCVTWEKKAIAEEEWSFIKPDSLHDIAALRFCN